MWWIVWGMVLFSAVELILRFQKGKELWENDSELGHRLKANKKGVWKTKEFKTSVAINSDGFIDEEFSAKKGHKKVFVFGSSFIEALQVPREKSVTYLLEKKLKNSSVFNFAISSYGPVHHLLLLKKYGPKYRPDVVVFTFLIGNDVKNVNPDLEESKNRPFAVPKDDKLEILPPRHYNSRLHSIARLVKKSFFVSEVLSSVQKSMRKHQTPLRFRAYEKNNPAFQKGYELDEAIILEAKKIANGLGSKFLLAVIPMFIEFDTSRWEKVKMRYTDLKNIEMDFEYPSTRLEAFCRKENMDCLLLKHAFADYLKKHNRLLIFDEDTHWNEAGHELAAEVISKKISEWFK